MMENFNLHKPLSGMPLHTLFFIYWEIGQVYLHYLFLKENV